MVNVTYNKRHLNNGHAPVINRAMLVIAGNYYNFGGNDPMPVMGFENQLTYNTNVRYLFSDRFLVSMNLLSFTACLIIC